MTKFPPHQSEDFLVSLQQNNNNNLLKHTEHTDTDTAEEEGKKKEKTGGRRRRARRRPRGEEDDCDWFNLLKKIERSFTRGERLDRFFEFDWMRVYSSKRARFGTIDETIESGSIDLHARRGGFWILRLGVIVRYDQVGGVDDEW
jgi:hypothetical protein|tara:strand:- start:928 stop:1362 length:435 start_codon:yes stop_codon:yes gene_type:complete